MPVTLSDVAAVTAMPDPAARNLHITRLYRDLALEVADVVGRTDVSWLAFGAWASLTAGRVIRGEATPLGLDLGTREAVGAGNRAIIADVAPRFVTWLSHVRTGGPSPLAWDRCRRDPLFCGAPQLEAAFAGYHEAAGLVATDPGLARPGADKRHAEVVLRSNVLVAAHEQRLADDFVDAAMPLGGIVGLVTTRFVTVETPDGPASVGRDVPRPAYLGGARYPEVLTRLEDADLVALVRAFGQDPGPGADDSDARSWEDYTERMGYITCFFRSYLREQRFYEPPDR